MFFFLSKFFAFFTKPSNLLFLLALTGLVLLATRFARAGRRLLVVSVILLLLFGISPLGRQLVLVLEGRFPAWDGSRGAPDGIIVLGGAIAPDVSAARGEIAVGGAAERMTVVADLARRYPNAKIVFTGGTPALFGGPREADYVRPLWESFGIAPNRIVLERDSRNTVENATMTKALLNPKPGERWLLVTSSWHMPRSVGVFRQAGFQVEPYPVDWVSRGDELGVLGLSESFAGGLHAIDNAAHEWVGMLMYWLTGRSSEFFPGPARKGGCDNASARDNCRP
ncbi:MAG TPA: YdcF family protein [Pseudorhodoplanes sp.]|nr:YdcF family protein [Pseudorhodoplanes sp.]